MIIFGCVAIAQGFVKNYSGLLACRFLLGLTESSVDPGCIYLIAMCVLHFSHQRYNGPEFFLLGGTSVVRPRNGSVSSLLLQLLVVLSPVFWPTLLPTWMARQGWPVGNGCSSSVCLFLLLPRSCIGLTRDFRGSNDRRMRHYCLLPRR